MTDSLVVIETGSKKVFASAIDWPGWSRSGKTESAALEALVDYVERYQAVTERAGIPGLDIAATNLEVVERITGTGATDFGVPDKDADCEHEPMTDAMCGQQIALLRGCWAVFDDVASSVSPELRKGPRGGGRDRDQIIEHTLEAERGYARQICVKTPKGTVFTDEGLAQHRDAVCEAILRRHRECGIEGKWPLRYFIRRAAWHVMDHAWEMEDKDLS